MNRTELFWAGVGIAVSYTVGRRLIRKVDDVTGEQGTAAGIKVLLSERNTHTTAEWDGNIERTQEILKDPTKPAILVSNHPHTLEPMMFLSELPSRQGVSIINVAGTDVALGKETQKNFVRVHHRSRFETQKQKKKRQEFNKGQILEAAKRLESGGSILIAPDGGDGTGKWKNGSVTLFEKALTLPEAYLVMGHVPNTTEYEHLRLVFKKKLERQVRVSEAINVKDISIPDNGRYDRRVVVSLALESYYNSWAKSK